MSNIKNFKISSGANFHVEEFDSSMEVVRVCADRKLTSGEFHDMPRYEIKPEWHGVTSYEEAMRYMESGYQPTVESLKSALKVKSGESTRFVQKNNVVGFAPVVPLALKNVPNCMMDMQMRPIKAKVVNIYYDMTASSCVSSDPIIGAGQKLLGAIIRLERQGYRFNLYAVQAYSDRTSCDMMVVRVKRDSQPLDLKRVSFPLTHTAFFRVIGFDWYSKVPGGKYRSGYGSALIHSFSKERIAEMSEKVFGKNALYISASEMIEKQANIEEVLTNGDRKN